MINGKAVVYEIKTELDTFERLESQICDYYKAFDHVCVVTSESQAEDLLIRFGDNPVGIYVLNDRNSLRRLKEPREFKENLDKEQIFKILNQSPAQIRLHVKYPGECININISIHSYKLKNLPKLDLDRLFNHIIRIFLQSYHQMMSIASP